MGTDTQFSTPKLAPIPRFSETDRTFDGEGLLGGKVAGFHAVYPAPEAYGNLYDFAHLGDYLSATPIDLFGIPGYNPVTDLRVSSSESLLSKSTRAS